ncbi:IS110 family transposase [Fimbriiglobus ruber]|uniref:Putative transposase n=1 Tax=Fimbriiglobus ruber TaxID=1908690 RepID=A0A225D100_9BACT|nr:IS110 family transposase [Fimbriiglobus ruber]OWK35271.1 putative transposase [Fimbriiglobus ruber]
MATDTIIAIDLGRFNSVACVYTRSTRAHTFRTLDTTPADVGRVLAAHPRAVVVIEACANAGWVHDQAIAAGYPVKVANTAAEAWKFQHLKRKTDKDDAVRLAELEAIGQLPTVALPDPATRERRALIAFRQELVGRRVACQNRIRALFAGHGLATPRGHRAWTATGLDGIAAQAKPLADCGPAELWKGMLDLAVTEYRALVDRIADAERALDVLAAADVRTTLLETIPGVGRRTAEAVAAHLGDPTRFASAKQVGAYAGLVPKQYQSGVTDRKGRITRRGPGVLRKLLVECAWCMLRYNPWARAQYARLTGGGASRKKPAIVALARKLLVRCWAILRSGQGWRADPVPAVVSG